MDEWVELYNRSVKRFEAVYRFRLGEARLEGRFRPFGRKLEACGPQTRSEVGCGGSRCERLEAVWTTDEPEGGQSGRCGQSGRWIGESPPSLWPIGLCVPPRAAGREVVLRGSYPV